METLKLVRLDWISPEREKYIWEDLYSRSWDEIIGRMYLLKAHSAVCYEDALPDFEQALILLAKDGCREGYYYRALADKALVQCFLGQYATVLAMVEQALAKLGSSYQKSLKLNRASILVLTGAYSEALTALEEEVRTHPDDTDLRFTMATCLLHLKRYKEAVAAYEQIAQKEHLPHMSGLQAARRRRQPDWDDL